MLSSLQSLFKCKQILPTGIAQKSADVFQLVTHNSTAVHQSQNHKKENHKIVFIFQQLSQLLTKLSEENTQ